MKTVRFIKISFLFILLFSFTGGNSQEIKSCKTDLQFYPKTFAENPGISSPFILKDSTEIIVAHLKNGEFAIVSVTVENGEPRNYNEGQWGKGNQLELGCDDFPALAKNGLHSEKELKRTQTITGKSVNQITKEGQPGISSFEGFLVEDEDIISVLTADNKLVKQLGFTHPEMAKPLFNIFNLILEHRKAYLTIDRAFPAFDFIFYNGHKISIESGGAKGWQTSIFNDGNLGYYWIKIRRELTAEEKAYLEKSYPDLNEEQFQKLVEKVSGFNTGEMVSYYIMHYGFYEGHTGYRADPISISLIFGLKTLPEIDKIFKHELPKFLRI